MIGKLIKSRECTGDSKIPISPIWRITFCVNIALIAAR